MQKIQYKHDRQPSLQGAEHRDVFFDTDRAWGKLYNRLDEEGLMPEVHAKAHHSRIPVWTKWAATLLILVTSGIFLFSVLQRQSASQFVILTSAEDNATMVHMLEDGTVVYLAGNTTLKVPISFDEKKRVVSLEGEAFFDIEHDPERPFFVEAGQVSIQVLGTAFNVRANSHDTFELFVERGLVRASLNKAGASALDAGQGELVRVNNNSLSKSPDNDYAKSAWKIQRMHFKDEPLGNILSVINRNYHANIVVQEADLENRRMTVTFYNNKLPTIIELICLSMNMEAEYASSSDVVLKPII